LIRKIYEYEFFFILEWFKTISWKNEYII
jgi:hypothetical protein